jgi:hypothetical protein
MKDIYIIMANQNILGFYGTKLDLKLDYSELYDFELSKIQGDYDSDVLDLTNPITYSGLTVDSDCRTTFTTPWTININESYVVDDCDIFLRKRTEKGWTLDFVFNGTTTGSTFYYWGIKNETDFHNLGDNNLSFGFTNDRRITWSAFRYSGHCDTISGYTENFYLSTGQTPTLCTNGISNDFNVTITFDRNKHYEDCDIENEGGHNDLVTGWTVTNPIESLSGDTETFTIIETLNKKWSDEREKRLGTLKIYLNGNPIYKIKDWEEVIPSPRNSINPISQIWGRDVSTYIIKRVKYFEEPLDFVHVRHHYLTSTKSLYTINECQQGCLQEIVGFYNNSLLSENGDVLLTEDNEILLY